MLWENLEESALAALAFADNYHPLKLERSGVVDCGRSSDCSHIVIFLPTESMNAEGMAEGRAKVPGPFS